LERARGIEPLSSDWKSVIIPLYYARLAKVRRIELLLLVLETSVIPFHYTLIKKPPVFLQRAMY
jgi:hypothetical protein